MPQELLPDPRAEFAATLADSGLPLLARAVAAGAIGGPGVRAVLDELAGLATDGYDDAALAEAEEYLTSVAAATDPAHVAQELRVHCDEVLRPHLAADEEDGLDDDASLDEVWPDEVWSDEAPPGEMAIAADSSHAGGTVAAADASPASEYVIAGDARDGRNDDIGADPAAVEGSMALTAARVVAQPSRGETASTDAEPFVVPRARAGGRAPADPARARGRLGRRGRGAGRPPVPRVPRRDRCERHVSPANRHGPKPGRSAAPPARTDRRRRTGRAPPRCPSPRRVACSPAHLCWSTPRRPDRPSHLSGTRSRSDGRDPTPHVPGGPPESRAARSSMGSAPYRRRPQPAPFSSSHSR